MSSSTYHLIALGFVVHIALLGCNSDEEVRQDPVTSRTGTTTEMRTTLSSEMDLTEAKRIFDQFGLVAKEDDSGLAMVGANSRRLLVGVNQNGDALFVTTSPASNGGEKIAGIFWHLDWVKDRSFPKSQRRDVIEDVEKIDLKDAELKAYGFVDRETNVDSDPFGG